MDEHVHQWKRWPVIQFSFDYSCAVCGEPGTAFLTAANAGRSIAEIDEEFAVSHGGVYAGEWSPPGSGPLPSFTCPCCRAVSFLPADLENGYCGNCHWWTADPALGPPHLEAPCPARPPASLRP